MKSLRVYVHIYIRIAKIRKTGGVHILKHTLNVTDISNMKSLIISVCVYRCVCAYVYPPCFAGFCTDYVVIVIHRNYLTTWLYNFLSTITMMLSVERILMSAHASLLPGEDKTHSVRIDNTGVSMSWGGWKAMVGAIVVVLFGSGSFVGFQFVTSADLNKAVVESEQLQESKLTPIRAEVAEIKNKVGDINDKLDGVQDFQYQQDARQEARRITDDIKDRRMRESEYDRIRILNEKRIKQGRDSCSTLDCIN